MEQKLLFVGFNEFDGKNEKQYNVLNFITQSKISKDGKRAYFSNITIFTSPEKYINFIKNVKLMSLVSVQYEINGEKIRYFI